MASKFLTKNMGNLDRALRAFVVAPAAIVAAFALGATSTAAIVLFAVAGLALVTGATGRCPNYVLFGIDTRIRRVHLRAPLPH
jgi:DUF2892 family protein